MNQGCPQPGQPLPPGQHGTFYAHGGYWCLNSSRYYSDVFGAVGGFLGMIVHAILLLLALVAALAMAVLLIITAIRLLGPGTRSRHLSQRWRRVLAPSLRDPGDEDA